MAPLLPTGISLRAFAEIDSTNEEAKRLGEAGEPGPIWITAERQTAGRGRRGREWVSPSGNFMGTLLLRPQANPRKAAELSFVAALAVHDAVDGLLSPALRPDLKLKWPNDLLHGGKKLAGILLESSGIAGGELAWLAIGIGINLAQYPEGVEYPATSLAALGVTDVTPDDALERLAAAFDRRIRQWRDVQGFAAIREAWLARAAGLGGSITVRLADETFDGVFAGLAPDGALEVRTASGETRQISAGDVFFRTGPR
ncbi:biotin--[acetyl-CoA-carboxylase] ligase [Parvibaculum sedimenti]|uniref:biotin--[biotin carboxyl-carrier protein] ligase n=3 Tax=Parvibaculum TaxID=256616 RepID=A0A6N6VF99_9HYPH|nr:biotin--[acetyl-CoA-carboxylase] ligase [Parvibaculum sedimenti]KAB7739289.1 biotin--[acetyl-CoA-carboxylase] ligase [Parvibaculum sedimenti]